MIYHRGTCDGETTSDEVKRGNSNNKVSYLTYLYKRAIAVELQYTTATVFVFPAYKFGYQAMLSILNN